jgi:hypothetical protein
MASNYDSVIGNLCRLEEELDLTKLKLEVVAKQPQTN